MPKESLDKMFNKFEDISKDHGYNYLKFRQNLEDTDFSTIQVESIDDFLKLLKLEVVNLKEIDGPKGMLDSGKLKSILEHKDDEHSNLGEKFKKIRSKKMTKDELSDDEIFILYLGELNYLFLSVICDYIAGMTDNYAKKEYKDLYLV